MARGELMKKLLASYGRDDEFRAVAEQIILEEEQKNNRVLARSLRQTLDHASNRAPPRGRWHHSFRSRTPPTISSSASSRSIPRATLFSARPISGFFPD